MTEHEQIQHELPAYIAVRLDAEEVKRLEAHLEVCDDCRGLVSTWRELISAMREGGDEIFEPHPAEMELRAFAQGDQGESGETRDRIQRHLAVCASCELEARSWGHQLRDDGARARGGSMLRQRRALSLAMLSAAAGIVLGLGLGLAIRGPGLVDGPALGEQVQHLVLPASPLRGNGEILRRTLRRHQSHLEIDFTTLPPPELPGESRYLFEILRDTGEKIWSTEMTVDSVRRVLESDSVVGFVFPTSLIGAGRYRCRMVSPAAPGGQNVRQVEIEILPPDR